jgi:hypothetical protein
MKAGFMPKHHEAAVSKASAWAEAIGYIANICLSLHKLEQLNLQEQQLLRKVQALCRVRCGSRDTWQGDGAHGGGGMGLLDVNPRS